MKDNIPDTPEAYRQWWIDNYPKYTVDPDTDCWIWRRAFTHEGYGLAYYGGRQHRAHRLIYECHHGPIPNGHHLHHRCEVRACVNPDHCEPLLPGPHAQRASHLKMSPKTVRRIRELHTEGGQTQRSLAKQFGIHEASISYIVNNKIWTSEPPVPKERQRGHGSRRLDLDVVRRIRTMYAEGGHTHQSLGEQFGVTGGAITLIINHRTYRDI